MHLFAPRMEVQSPLPRARIPYTDPFRARWEPTLRAAGVARLTLDEDTWDNTARGAVGADVECFWNFFVVCFKRFADGKYIAFERSARAAFDADAVREIIANNTIVTFNGIAYDAAMIALALSGADPRRMKEASDELIKGGGRPWEAEERLGVRIPPFDHIDLLEPNPAVRQGLKVIGGRLHCRYLVDLPFDPDATLSPKDMNYATAYCLNDLDVTEDLYRKLREPLELRAALGRAYGMDLRSKSDAQVGEAIVRRRVEAATGRRARPAPAPRLFNYTPPPFIEFHTRSLRDLLEEIRGTTFAVVGDKVGLPKELEGRVVRLDDMTYKMGIGGLHSTESHRATLSDETGFLMDVDVASQYPNIIRKLGLYPPGLGPEFLVVYGGLIDERLAAKAAGDKVRADGGRIALNGVFGKLGSPYSVCYAPQLLIATTLTGQITILSLIERAVEAGVRVVSANTDGVVFKCPLGKAATLDALISSWEDTTGFQIERTRYRALYSSSVNCYVALKDDGKVKRKGPISDPWEEGDVRGQIMKNPQMTVCSAAAVRYLADRVPLEQTIRAEQDMRKFVAVVKVTGGAMWRGHPLGRAVRYYYSLDGESIVYAGSGKRVGRTEGARPAQEMLTAPPPDLDRQRYLQVAADLLTDLGVQV
jgi:hypothetical protein